MSRENKQKTTQIYPKRFSLLLIPGIVQGILSFSIIPLSTKILNPSDFGKFALINTITTTTAVLICSGSNYLINNRYEEQKNNQHNQVLISTVTFLNIFNSLLISFLIILIFSFLKQKNSFINDIPISYIFLSMIEMIGISLWTLGITISTLNKDVKIISIYSIARTIVRNTSIVLCLYFFGIQDALALFIGSACSGILIILGYFKITDGLIKKRFRIKIAKETFKVGSYFSISNLLELLYKSSETWILAAYQNLTTLGIFSHAQFYPNFARTFLQPAQQAAWPTTRTEAKDINPKFLKSKIIFQFISLCIIFISILFALVGKELISLITNDKFTNSAPFVAILMASSSFRHFSGRSQHANLIVNNKPKYSAFAIGGSAFAGILINIILVPKLGIIGSLIASIINSITFLIILYLTSNIISKTPNFDLGNILGFILTIILVLIVNIYDLSLSLRILLLTFFSLIIIRLFSYLIIKNKVLNKIKLNKK